MKATDCLRLENDNIFKGKYLRMISWWKTPLVIAPILILFTGVLGLIYCLKADLLLSFYSIPYIIVFLAGTIWFKALKRHLFQTRLNNPKAFKVCIGSILFSEGGYYYIIFTNAQKRHNEHFIKSIRAEFPPESVNLSNIKTNQAIEISALDDTSLLLTKISKGKLTKSIADATPESSIPLLFIDNKNIFVILKRDQQA